MNREGSFKWSYTIQLIMWGGVDVWDMVEGVGVWDMVEGVGVWDIVKGYVFGYCRGVGVFGILWRV